jgi:hypothetical protein
MNENKNRLFTMKIIWGALLASIFIYGIVAWMKAQNAPVPGESPKEILFAVSCAAVTCALAAFIVPKLIFKNSPAGKNPPAQFMDMLASIFPALIIRLALTESVAICGFILTFQSGKIEYFLLFAAPAVLMYLISFPSEANLRKLVGLPAAIDN